MFKIKRPLYGRKEELNESACRWRGMQQTGQNRETITVIRGGCGGVQ